MGTLVTQCVTDSPRSSRNRNDNDITIREKLHTGKEKEGKQKIEERERQASERASQPASQKASKQARMDTHMQTSVSNPTKQTPANVELSLGHWLLALQHLHRPWISCVRPWLGFFEEYTSWCLVGNGGMGCGDYDWGL